jgi:hypothetical protein
MVPLGIGKYAHFQFHDEDKNLSMDVSYHQEILIPIDKKFILLLH